MAENVQHMWEKSQPADGPELRDFESRRMEGSPTPETETSISIPRSVPDPPVVDQSKTDSDIDSSEYVVTDGEPYSSDESQRQWKGKAKDFTSENYRDNDSWCMVQSAKLNTNSQLHESITSYYGGGAVSHSASSVDNLPEIDLVDFLAVVQHRRIDLLPFQWEDGQNLGMGGNAKISQGGNVKTSQGDNITFAFKRFQRETDYKAPHKAFQALLSEVYILGHPVVRQHPNINALQGVCWDVVYGQPWPVLVFKKTEYGDLKQFMTTPEGRALDFVDKINLCWDIGNAIKLMHTCHAVHGDLKPDNVLIFKDHSGKFSAKVTDFGYSTIFASDNNDAGITLPRSWPWTAPDVEESTRVTLDQAKSADIFSYGLICYWLLCYDLLPRDVNNGHDAPDLHHIDELKKHTELITIVEQDIKAIPGNSDVLILSWFLDLTLSQRTLNLDSLPIPTGKLRKPPPLMEEYGKSALLKTTASFNLVNSLSQFRICRGATKKAVFKCLETRANTHSDPTIRGNSAYDLALCYTIGFGVSPDVKEADGWLERTDRPRQNLEDAIEMFKHDTSSLYHNINAKVDYFDAARPQKSQPDNISQSGRATEPIFPEGDDKDVLITPTDEDAMVLGATAAWVHKMIGIEPGEIRMVFDTAESQLSQQEFNALLQDQFGWESGGGTTTTINLVLNQDDGENDSDGERSAPGPSRAAKMDTDLSAVTVSPMPPITPKRRVEKRKMPQTTEEEIRQVRGSLDKKIKVIGPEHEDSLRDMDKLVQLHLQLHQWDEIEALAMSIVSTRQKILGAENPTTLGSMEKLLGALMMKEDMDEAERLALEIFDARKRVLGVKHETTLRTLRALEWLIKEYTGREMLDKTITLLEKTVEVETEAYGPEDKRTLWNMRSLALVYVQNERYEEGEKLIKCIISNTKKLHGEDHEEVIQSRQLLAGLYALQISGNKEKSELLQKMHKLQTQIEQSKARLASINADHNHTGLSHADDEDICEHRKDDKDTIGQMSGLILDYLQQGINTDEVDQGIAAAESLLETLDDDSPSRATVLAALARGYVDRFRHLNDADDIDTGIMWAEQASLVLPDDHEDKALRVSELGSYIHTRYDVKRSLEDLDSAITCAEEAVQATADGDSALTQRMEDLAQRLKERHDKTMDIDDLNTALMWAEQVNSAISKTDSRRSWWLVLLSTWSKEKYGLLNDMDALGDAIAAMELIQDDCVVLDAPTQMQMYDELSDLYEERFCTMQGLDDLHNCIWKAEQAANLASGMGEDGPRIGGDKPHGILLMKLAWKLFMRAMLQQTREDLDEAMVKIEQAAQLVPAYSVNQERLQGIRHQIQGASNRVAQGKHGLLV
ncbi:hypothetical protein DRE_03410 [Drechslerella stenobrocha 248]|uniref:Protein kinase domain-containing protein n=1 Tax=Drechslerella stenobrocha 248 TaxID=1043628 RepID=W7HT73_9PEZI|nr:hypothetical protein DRE_03410 [Drechslerella stenobrocha 248]